MAKTLQQRIDREQRIGFRLHNRVRIRVMQLTANATRHELKIKALLDELGLRYQFQKGFTAKGVLYIADFYLPKPIKCVIEIDGSSHLSKIQQEKDRLRDIYFRTTRRIRVLRITNQDVEYMNSQDLERQIQLVRQTQQVCYERSPRVLS
jgi:very-short-patch-repair endonuclease